LIAYSLGNISAKNYQSRLMCFEVIVCYISRFSETQCSTSQVMTPIWRFWTDATYFGRRGFSVFVCLLSVMKNWKQIIKLCWDMFDLLQFDSCIEFRPGLTIVH